MAGEAMDDVHGIRDISPSRFADDHPAVAGAEIYGDALHTTTPFLRMMFAYKAVSPVATTAKAFFVRS
jgi:hypothetical protein